MTYMFWGLSLRDGRHRLARQASLTEDEGRLATNNARDRDEAAYEPPMFSVTKTYGVAQLFLATLAKVRRPCCHSDRDAAGWRRCSEIGLATILRSVIKTANPCCERQHCSRKGKTSRRRSRNVGGKFCKASR